MSARRPRVLLDIDGVVGDFISSALEIVTELGVAGLTADGIVDTRMENLLPSEHRETFLDRLRQRGFCTRLRPYPGAVEFVRELQRRHDVAVVTTAMPGSETWAHERENWLAETFDLRTVISTRHKDWIVGDYLIEDTIANAVAWTHAHPHGVAMLIDRPYNRGYTLIDRIVRCRSLPAVLGAIDRSVAERSLA